VHVCNIDLWLIFWIIYMPMKSVHSVTLLFVSIYVEGYLSGYVHVKEDPIISAVFPCAYTHRTGHQNTVGH
jgi:hypothetical protein